MSEPTKEAMDEAIGLRLKFCAPNGKMSSFEVAKLIAEVRTQENNDALERCASLCEKARPTGGRAWDEAQAACFDALTHVAKHIRAKKVPT